MLTCAAHAQAVHGQKIIIRDGKLVSGTLPTAGQAAAPRNVEASQSRLLLFKAQEKLMKRDFSGAEQIYTQAIALDDSNVTAYLQRGVVRRELRNYRGVDSDARTVVALSNRIISANPRDPDGYYKRSMALRLLHQFDQAKKDVLTAIQLGGKLSLKNDLKAIELERRMAASTVSAAR